MAEVVQRTWRSGPRKVRKAAWGYTFQRDGKQFRKYDGAWTKEDAEQALAAVILERDAPKAAPAAPGSMTLGVAVTRYLKAKEAGQKRSLRNDRMGLARLKVFFGEDAPLSAITATRIAEYGWQRLTEMSERLGRPVKPASLNKDLAILRHLLRLAHEWGDLAAVPRIRLEREPEGRLRFLSEDEATRLLAKCHEAATHPVSSCRSPYLEAIVIVALNTGMRSGEVLGLAWDRVDFARGVLQLERTKSGRRREVPMNRAVYDVLAVLHREQEKHVDGELRGPVFRKASGDAWGSIRTAFPRACREAKVEDFRFHDLRHTFASWLVMRGRSLKEVQELLGHKTLTMTLRYAHLSPDRLRDAVTALDDFSTQSAQGAVQDAQPLVSSRRD